MLIKYWSDRIFIDMLPIKRHYNELMKVRRVQTKRSTPSLSYRHNYSVYRFHHADPFTFLSLSGLHHNNRRFSLKNETFSLARTCILQLWLLFDSVADLEGA